MDDDLFDMFGKIRAVETIQPVYASAKIYPNSVKLFKPKAPYSKRIPFMELRIDEHDEIVTDWDTDFAVAHDINEDSIERSLRRSKVLLSDYVLCNEFDLFATFTFSPGKSDRQNPSAVKLQMSNWLRNQRKRKGRFKYVIVPEFHKDRRSLHFHALFKDYDGELIDSGKIHKGRKIYHFQSYTLGFNSAIYIDNIPAVSNYVRKYITKDMPQFRDKRRFWNTLNLEKPIVVDNPSPEAIQGFGVPMKVYEGLYGTTTYFERKKDGEEVQGS